MSGSAQLQPPDAKGGYLSVNLASLRLDSVTNFDIYFQPRPDQPYVLYAERNIRFSDEVRSRLIENRLNTVYIRESQRADYARYLADHLPAILRDGAVPVEEKTGILYASACGVVESILTEPEAAGLRQSRDMVRHAVDLMLADRRVFSCLLKAIASTYQIYTHSVNVLTYTIALAQRLGYADPALLRELAVGALLHDVGKSRVDSAILDHQGTLNEREWAVMKQHPVFGYQLLTDIGGVGEIALDIVLHHHEKIRGGGYPDNLAGNAVSPFVRIVTIADTFDAMTTERPFQKARTSFNALALMNVKSGGDFDRQMLRAFVGMMGHPVAK